MKNSGLLLLHFSLIISITACDPVEKTDLVEERQASEGFTTPQRQQRRSTSRLSRRSSHGSDGSASSTLSAPSSQSTAGSLPARVVGDSETRSTHPAVEVENLKIDKNGFLSGTNVFNDISEAKTWDTNFRSGAASPDGLILHKTGGMGESCRDDNTVGNKAPHIYICSDGRIIVNGTFDKPRTSAEHGHNSWSLNIEFDNTYEGIDEYAKSVSGKTPSQVKNIISDCYSNYKSYCKGEKATIFSNWKAYNRRICQNRGERTQGMTLSSNGWGHCYTPLTQAQVASAKKVMALIEKRYDIPQKLSLPIESQQHYYSSSTRVIKAGKSATSSPRNVTIDQMDKGILPSFWTFLSNTNDTNHDDGPSLADLKALGVIDEDLPKRVDEGAGIPAQ